MKILYCCLLIISLAILSGCMSMSGYKEASHRYRTYAGGEKDATVEEWRALVLEFEKIIDTDPQGTFADNAQYAIASSWVWGITAGDPEAPQQAIEAFQKLVRTYPNSQYVPHAHYWLGRCYDYINKDYQAITQYQIVENRYADSELLEPAQLELARLYARQGYITRAETFYNNLINSSTNREIVADASAELQTLKPGRKQVVSPPQNSVQIQRQTQARTKPKPKLSTLTPEAKGLVPESLTREFGLMAKTIVIDPGHGGRDPGASGSGILHEKDIALNISEKLYEVLTARGYTVLMTRDTDHLIPLKARTEFATQHKADLFLSIHVNGSENSQATGIETYYLDVGSTDKASEQIAARENADSGYSIQELEVLLKGLIQESKREDSRRLAEHVQQRLVQVTGAVDRGVKHARFVVLIGANVPSILVEAGFISNPTESRKLITSAYQDKIATAIADGVDKFLERTGETPVVRSQRSKLAAKSNEGKR